MKQCRTTNYQGLALSIRQRDVERPDLLGHTPVRQLTDIASSVCDASILTGPLDGTPPSTTVTIWSVIATTRRQTSALLRAYVVWDLPAGKGRAKHPTGVVGALVRDGASRPS